MDSRKCQTATASPAKPGISRYIRRDNPEHLPEFEIALHTGARQSEQYRLMWPDVDLDGKQITFRKTKNGDTRHVPLNTVARRAFLELRNGSKGQGRVFLGEHGRALKKPRYWWDVAVKEAKLEDFHWHDLRHCFASNLVMTGVDLRTVAQLLGHRTLQMVMRYSHLS